MDIQYREARPEDAAALLEYMKIIGSESDNLTFGAAGIPLTVQQYQQILARLQASPRSRLLLAFEGDAIVGNCSIEGTGNPRFSHRCGFAIALRKSHWGRGIGSELTRQQLEFAKNAGISVVSLEVRADNEAARALYRKFGFEKFGTYRNYFFINGEYFDADYMNLYL